MKKSWRNLALILFAGALLFGGLFGDSLLAVTDQVKSNVRLYTELIDIAHQRYGSDVKYRDLVYASIHGMLRSLDPHTSFLSAEAYESMREKQQSSFYGLGIFVGQRNGQLTVITPIEGTPASRMGMRAGDVIYAIDGKLTEEMSSDEAISHLKGPKDTEVVVTILRPGLDEPLDLAITRAEISQTTVQYAYMIQPGTGYLKINDFSRSTGSEVARALDKLRGQGMERLILDLRNNGGGLLDQAIVVADQFVPGDTKIVETRGRIPSSFSSYSSSGTYEALGLPLVVLVNSGSASASEILAGAIQDHDVGLVLGEPTWGKGLVQTVYSLSRGAGLALTTARYYTPSGRLIQRDYTSYWDYYTGYDGEATPESIEEEGSEDVFFTDTGRKVYGGGGITPDVHVEPGDLSPFLQKVLSRSGYFTFAVEYASRNDISDGWMPDEKVFDELSSWLAENDYASPEEIAEAFADDEVVEYTTHRLRFEVFNSEFGLEAGHRALIVVDNQIAEANDLFEDAAALLTRRQALDNDREPSQADQKVAAAGAGG